MMQQGSCEEIQLLISRYVDDEVTPEEHELVETHVATCEACSYRLLEWVEMAAIIAETPAQQPDPELRAGLYRAIYAQKDEAYRKAERVSAEPVAWRAATNSTELEKRPNPLPFRKRLMQAANPVMAAVLPILFLLGSLLVISRLFPESPVSPVIQSIDVVQPIATSELPVGEAVPPAVGTKIGQAIPSPGSSTSTYMSATATLGPYTLIDLKQPTPVWEEGDATGKTDWHAVRDPQYGYKMAYPPNWWTHVLKDTRYFFPWTGGGTKYAPYWITLKVLKNDNGLTAETGNVALCGGTCHVASKSGETAGWIDRKGSDGNNAYHDGYLFDSDYIYSLRLNVPSQLIEGMGGFQERFSIGEGVFTTMSGRLTLASEQVKGESAFGSMLFLKGGDPNMGSDLYKTVADGLGGRRLTWDGGLKNYALSPTLDKIVFASTVKGQARDTWAKNVYLAQFTTDGTIETPELLVGNMDAIQDIAWYGDREVVFLARSVGGVLGLYKLNIAGIGNAKFSASDQGLQPELLVRLDYELAGARSLAVSPDRQLITFLAPLGENSTTNLYGVRPDGSDLKVLISHAWPISAIVNGVPVLDPESQAIKSYVWIEGHLEPDGYMAKVLFTSGNSYSPTYVLGGGLYSGPRKNLNPLVDQFELVNYEPERLQIIHIAYSSWGKVAFTGYYNDFGGRTDKLEGLWVADIVGDGISTPSRVPTPDEYNGVTDLQWSPNGQSLLYRETIPTGNAPTARYNGEPTFRIMKLDLTPDPAPARILYDSGP